MTTAPVTARRFDRPAAALAWCRRNVHFLIAATVLVLATGWWLFARDVLRWVFIKEPVTWPIGVVVSEDFRLLSLAEVFGPYEKVQRDGEIHKPDGEIKLPTDMMHTLGVGTSYDQSRYADRQSNWYVSRVYRDNREPPGSPWRYWRLDVTYYTGSVDPVPHVPEVCLFAGGADPLPADIVAFKVQGNPDPWNGEIAFNRTPYAVSSGGVDRQYVQYYAFSLNGRPETSREGVRLHLMLPWVRRSYFAKIQFGPMGYADDLELANRKAGDFVRNFLPGVLEALPMPSDIDNARSGGEASR